MTETATVARSDDGRRFTFAGPARYLPGDLLTLHASAGLLLGQVVERSTGSLGGAGIVLGALATGGTFDGGPQPAFAAAASEPAEAAHLEALQAASQARLEVGTWTAGHTGVAARLRAQGFARHTFLCGQSGSGKTYALGVLLEQLHLDTSLRIVVIDPNADFVTLNEVRRGTAEGLRERWSRHRATVLGSALTGATPLRLRFAAMPRAAQAALLRLDPLADRGEYNLFLHRTEGGQAQDLPGVVAELRQGGADEQALAQRVENLGLLDWEVWANEVRSAAEVVQGGSSLTVLDLNGFGDPLEPIATCLDLVEQLWACRERRIPTLIVVDEAHNLCPAAPTGTVQSALVERLIQIAAEGRKYGLWLLVSTQRPSKLHPQVLSQCDNLVLMRMNSRADLAEIGGVFGFVPPALLDASPTFTQGEALVAGPLVPVPTLLRVGERITVEGGSDVRVPTRPLDDPGRLEGGTQR